MHISPPSELGQLTDYINRFLALVGRDRWFKRVDQLDADHRKSPYLWKIVTDYHWLEFALSFQVDVLAKEGRLIPELVDRYVLSALNFAASTVEVHSRLSAKGQNTLEGRLRDSLKAEAGFAPLYLEIDLAQRLMDDGYDVRFVDMEGEAQFDIAFSRGPFSGEVECKSLSADAGRQIHRKDFYRFMDAIGQALASQRELQRQEILLITLKARLSPNIQQQADLVQAAIWMLGSGAPAIVERPDFMLERRPYPENLARMPLSDRNAFYKVFSIAFGPNIHVAGELSEQGGCAIVMRSQRQDDTSQPMLQAMRKAASQFTGKRPSFIAIQEHGIDAPDLMLPRVRRQVGILSYALYGHYKASHVNAVCVTGFGAVVARDGKILTPAFAIENPAPAYPLGATEALRILKFASDAEYAAAIGAPLPAPNISFIPLDAPDRDSDLA